VNQPLSTGAEEYLSWLAVEKGRSRNTLAAYRRDIGAWEHWARNAGVEPLDAGPDAIERYLAELDSHPAEVLIVSLADKLYNARAVERDYRAYGESFWSRFNGGREGTLWYYTALSEAFDRLMPECRMTAELRAVVATLNDAAASVQH